jgi:hypothetical protein
VALAWCRATPPSLAGYVPRVAAGSEVRPRLYRPRVAVTFITRATLTSTFAVRATCGLRYAYQPCVADRPPQKLSVAWRIEGPGPGQRSPTEWSGGQYSRGGLDWRPICVPPVPPVPPLPPGCDLSRNMSHTTCGHTNALWATRGHKHTHTRSVQATRGTNSQAWH